jgi:hypothetical protein
MDQSFGRINDGIRKQLDHSDRGRRVLGEIDGYLEKIANCRRVDEIKAVLDKAIQRLGQLYVPGDREYLMLEMELNQEAHHTVQRLYFNNQIQAEIFTYNEDELDELQGILDKTRLGSAASIFRDAVIKMESAHNEETIMRVYDEAMDLLERIYLEDDTKRDLSIWRSLLALRRKSSLDSMG